MTYNQIIDEICESLYKPSAEKLNILHACRTNHPLGMENTEQQNFRNAWFALNGSLAGHIAYKHEAWFKQKCQFTAS